MGSAVSEHLLVDGLALLAQVERQGEVTRRRIDDTDAIVPRRRVIGGRRIEILDDEQPGRDRRARDVDVAEPLWPQFRWVRVAELLAIGCRNHDDGATRRDGVWFGERDDFCRRIGSDGGQVAGKRDAGQLDPGSCALPRNECARLAISGRRCRGDHCRTVRLKETLVYSADDPVVHHGDVAIGRHHRNIRHRTEQCPGRSGGRCRRRLRRRRQRHSCGCRLPRSRSTCRSSLVRRHLLCRCGSFGSGSVGGAPTEHEDDCDQRGSLHTHPDTALASPVPNHDEPIVVAISTALSRVTVASSR